MDMTYTLRPHQQEVVELGKEKLLLEHSLGSGKTLSGIELAKKYLTADNYLLVLCIKSKKLEFEADMIEHNITNSIVMTKDYYRPYGLPDADIGAVIIDECDVVCSGYDSKQFQVLNEWLRTRRHIPIYGLSATLISSTWKNVFCYYCLFGLIEDEEKEFKEWEKIFSEPEMIWTKTKQGRAVRIWKPSEKRDEDTVRELLWRLQQITHTYIVENPNNIHKQIIVPIPLVLPEPNEAGNITVHDFYKQENRHQNKIDMLRELVIPWTVIVCKYTDEVEMLKRLFNCPAISGKHSFKLEYADEPLLVLQADSGTGFGLPNHQRMIFFSYSYAYKKNKQARGRIDRDPLCIKSNKACEYYYLITHYSNCREKTMDEQVLESVKKGYNYDPANWNMRNYKKFGISEQLSPTTF
jgi:superfamily II DNA or RNA helicase